MIFQFGQHLILKIGGEAGIDGNNALSKVVSISVNFVVDTANRTGLSIMRNVVFVEDIK